MSLDRIRAFLRPEKAASLDDGIASIPAPDSFMRPDVEDPIGAQGDAASGKATHEAHPELGPMDEYLTHARQHVDDGEQLP